MKFMHYVIALLMIAAPSFSQAEDYKATGWRKDALDYILQENPTIMEAEWTQDISFWAFRIDDGTSHNGFARYLCVELHRNGMPVGEIVIIHIWSYQAALARELKEIGRDDCEHKGAASPQDE